MVRKLSLRGLFQTVCLLMQVFFIYFESNQKGKKPIFLPLLQDLEQR